MRENLAKLLFLAAAAVNLAPAGVAFAPDRVVDLYGIAPLTDASLLVLMKHRALLLGIVGVLLAGAAFARNWRVPATVAGLLSMGTFVVLYGLAGAELPKLARVAWIDLGAMFLVILAAWLGRDRRGASFPVRNP
jgi:hypothetical protein